MSAQTDDRWADLRAAAAPEMPIGRKAVGVTVSLVDLKSLLAERDALAAVLREMVDTEEAVLDTSTHKQRIQAISFRDDLIARAQALLAGGGGLQELPDVKAGS